MFRIYETLKYLADIDYTAGDRKLAPYRDRVYAWLETKQLEPLYIKDKHRIHGSNPGNAIYLLLRQILENTREVRLLFT